MASPATDVTLAPWPAWLGVALWLLASLAALDLGHRLARCSGHERHGWLLAAAVALATGLWAAPMGSVAEPLAAAGGGFRPVVVVGTAALTLALTLAGLALGLARPGGGRARSLGAAALVGSAAVAPQVLATQAAAWQLAPPWPLPEAALAWLVASAGFAMARLGPADAGDAGDAGPARPLRQALALLATVGALALAQALVAAGAGPGPWSPRLDDTLWPAATLATVASLGSTELLLLLLLASAVEKRLRGRFEQAQAALQARAQRDEMTGLPNRAAFEAALARALQQADDVHGQVAVLVVALDGFKHVNEAHGHQAGDELLRLLAQRLLALAEPSRLARLGGDEFLMRVDGADPEAEALALAQRVLEAVARPGVWQGEAMGVTASVGIALYPQHGAASTLLAHAGVAMRASKHAGGATHSLFDPRMVVDTRDQAELLRDLRLALRRGELELVYQPKVHAPSAQVTGVEALLRWHHPQRGTISPTVFIPMAERAGLINALGDWVIEEACRQARAWRDQGLRMRVAVNLSAYQLRQPDLPQRIAAALARHHVHPELLTCEITESVAMEDTELTLRLFDALAAVGVHISIDDFGSGYSSLAYLRKLPAGELKIDRAFVCDIEHSEEARKIAAAVVHLAQALQLKVVAEGVETEGQFQILRRFGCDELQGFLFAKPMSARALGLWASHDEAPRAVAFRESLFRETRAAAL